MHRGLGGVAIHIKLTYEHGIAYTSKPQPTPFDPPASTNTLPAAGSQVPHLAKAAGSHFVEPFGVFLAVLKPYGAPNRHDALRTALVGCFAEVIEAQGMLVAPHAPQLFELLAETIKDEEAEVSRGSALT